MGLIVGIDLGTTNSAIARLNTDGKPVLIPNREGGLITPSVICFRDGSVLVGEPAKEMQALGMWPVAAFFKRQMGDAQFVFHVNGVDYTATDLSAIILRKLKADAEAFTKEKVTHAVITVPAYFRDGERKATIEAGKAAGLEVLQVINEPTAAAVAYGLSREEDNRRILVYDLGGGTFDVTLLELTKEGVKVCTSDGNHQLGGKDWDDRIIEFLAGQFQDEFGVDPIESAESLSDLLIQAENAKKKLTTFSSTTIAITHSGFRGRYQLERSKFEEFTSDLMERTMSLTLRVLEDMRITPKDVDGVLLVGGSTRMPMVHRFIQETFDKPPMGGVNVDEAVALGAAVVAAEQLARRNQSGAVFALRGSVKIVDVTNHSLGMIAVNADQSAYINSIILPKNTPIPCEQTRPYQHRTRSRGDNYVEIFMTQSETESPEDAAYVGKYIVHGIPHHASGTNVIDVTYHYDRSGIVEISACLKESKQELRVTVEGLPNDVLARFLVPPDTHKIEIPEHLTAYLAFDLSGSMSGQPIQEAKKAALGFLRNIDLSHCSLGVIAFSDAVRTKLVASQNARQIERAVNDLQVCETGAGNSTHPFDELQSLFKSPQGRSIAVVLADGEWSYQAQAIERAKACHAANIDVIAIGFGSADQAFLRAIASSDEASFYTSMSGLVETFTTIAQVLTDTGGGALSDSHRRDDANGEPATFLSSISKAIRR